MNATLDEQAFYGKDVVVLSRDEASAAYKITDSSGAMIMTSYQVFKGIELVYNDVHMQSCTIDIAPPDDIILINHCREGRMECEFDNGEYLYLEKDDLSIQEKKGSCRSSYYPLSHYHGVSIVIHTKEAAKALSGVLDNIAIDINGLPARLTGKNKFLIMRAKNEIKHIFSELYTIPGEIRRDYFKLKVLELLLFLNMSSLYAVKEQRQYYPKKQVDKVKAIKKYISQNVDRHYTITELSIKFNISLTTMKACFKGVYGTPIYTYIRNYRMHAAAVMLKQTDDSVLTIAGKLGYDNGSKFASAFRQIMGVSPSEYRNISVQTELFLSE